MCDYAASYPHDSDSSASGDVVIKQNQMLPIYCSIMGMIIISLLLYVVYKLWKQREAMASAKLSEVFANGTNGMDKALIRTPPPPGATNTTSGPSPTVVAVTEATHPSGMTNLGAVEGHHYDDELHHHHHAHSQCGTETRSHTKRSGHKARDSHTSTVPEKHPLIPNAKSSSTERDYLEQPVNVVVPQNTLGFVCYSLAQNGWRELAVTTGFNSTDLDQLDQLTSEQRTPWPLPDNLLQAARDAKSHESGAPHSELELTQAVLVVSKLLEQQDMTFGTFLTALGQSNRSDLVTMLASTNGS
ncbi:unnamed protein product [Echinostoma caproni]|uniref:TNFR_16_TM domain-containing protein n=1 Tax=Echinostoma caproni TaxID=27848 RepID=A0A183AT37_9TREM|nr:unnamed protein product [Echinostoma caproni]